MGLRETLEAARSPAITESRGLLSEDHSEIETVPDESREVWTRQPTSGYTVEQYECDRAARKNRAR